MMRPITQEDIDQRLIRDGQERYKNNGRFSQPGSTFMDSEIIPMLRLLVILAIGAGVIIGSVIYIAYRLS